MSAIVRQGVNGNVYECGCEHDTVKYSVRVGGCEGVSAGVTRRCVGWGVGCDAGMRACVCRNACVRV